jgi:hypothetical protein
MRAGKNFPDLFAADNYALRHSTGHNMLDPESLITGREIANGLTYDNSHRDYVSQGAYLRVVSGEIETQRLVIVAPRMENDWQCY